MSLRQRHVFAGQAELLARAQRVVLAGAGRQEPLDHRTAGRNQVKVAVTDVERPQRIVGRREERHRVVGNRELLLLAMLGFLQSGQALLRQVGRQGRAVLGLK